MQVYKERVLSATERLLQEELEIGGKDIGDFCTHITKVVGNVVLFKTAKTRKTKVNRSVSQTKDNVRNLF